MERGTYLPYALTISHLNYLGKLAAFRQGKFAVQDESSQLAVEVADINEGDSVRHQVGRHSMRQTGFMEPERFFREI